MVVVAMSMVPLRLPAASGSVVALLAAPVRLSLVAAACSAVPVSEVGVLVVAEAPVLACPDVFPPIVLLGMGRIV